MIRTSQSTVVAPCMFLPDDLLEITFLHIRFETAIYPVMHTPHLNCTLFETHHMQHRIHERSKPREEGGYTPRLNRAASRLLNLRQTPRFVAQQDTRSRARYSPRRRVVVNKTADTLPKVQADYMFIRTVVDSNTQPCITLVETRSGAVISFMCARWIRDFDARNPSSLRVLRFPQSG